ncbi:hypothetical protein JR316_0011294 [Psilocybe cubensis]|uniref:Uncharacterized protein n=2 Tax=Psilocybe cubensis TaxID=181762 RepID=A0A8H7XWX0_PSICU|nr:hypothetical protein JR316_0011294 [Psilocybe cubensis]KAH9475735.1 hypothetical protein JR316_0011294 [Psilocybe cubensis]
MSDSESFFDQPLITIRPFNPFDIQVGSQKAEQVLAQGIIYCGASRLREALIHIIDASLDNHGWMQRCLQEELHYIMAVVGQAYAVGWVLDIPYILRLLSESLFACLPEEFPMDFHPDLLPSLAADDNDQGFEKGVKKYLYDWWTRNTPPSPERMLNHLTIGKIMKFHGEQYAKSFPKAKDSTKPLPPAEPSGIRHGQLSTLDPPPDAPGQTNFIYPTQIVPDSKPGDIHCGCCAKFRNLSDDLLVQFRGVKNFSTCLADVASNQVACISRRAMGFFKLYELSQELDDAAIEGAATYGRDNIKTRKPEIPADLMNSKQTPPSDKWTWGKSLTIKDVLSISEVSNPKEHTGYAKNLKEGQKVKYSTEDSLSQVGTFDSAAISAVQTLPSATFTQPDYFKYGTEGSPPSSVGDFAEVADQVPLSSVEDFTEAADPVSSNGNSSDSESDNDIINQAANDNLFGSESDDSLDAALGLFDDDSSTNAGSDDNLGGTLDEETGRQSDIAEDEGSGSEFQSESGM